MDDAYKIVASMIRTEKGTSLEAYGKYLFWVSKKANKIEIKKAVQELYKVKVLGVNTVTMRGKRRRVRLQQGKTPDWKKAIVTLEKGQKIESA